MNIGHQNGQIGEIAFMLAALKEGIASSKPMSDKSRYDVITEYNGITYKVQIKSSKSSKVKLFSADNTAARYTVEDVDFFALTSSGSWFIVPIADILGRASMRFRLNGNGKKYLERWDLLKQRR